MRRAAATLIAALALSALAAAPGALAATFTVSNTSDGGPGSLRDALVLADANPGQDLVIFDDALGSATIVADSTLPTPAGVADEVAIEGGGDITVVQSSAVSGPLLRFNSSAAGSAVRNIVLAGPGAGTSPGTALVSTAASDTTVATSTLRDAPTAAVSIDGGAQRVRVTQNTIHGYGAKAVSFDAPGVNGGIGAPANLRVGPRRADGTLPLTGSTGPAGALEVFRGPLQPYAFGSSVGGGDFAVVPAPEPAPGENITATITDAAGNTSEYATAFVPSDIVSPQPLGAVATSLNTIDVLASEPLDPATVQPEDFAVQMAGVNRTILGATASADGRRITLFFEDAWDAGEAGIMRVTGPGAFADAAGNASLGAPELRVGGAPGDFVAPAITRFRLNPKRGVCFVLGPRCKRDRTAIIFRSSEDGDTFIRVFRGTRLIGERRYTGQPGANFIRFDGKIRGRRLKPGLYRMFVAMQDDVGNRTPVAEQPGANFRVKRTR